MVSTISATHVDVGGDKEAGEKGETWKQWVMTFIATLPLFTSALQRTYVTGVLTDEPPYWVSTAMLIGCVVSTPVLCWLADKFGRRSVLLAVSVVQIISWIPLLFDLNKTTLIVSSSVIGISLGGILTTTPIYILETNNLKTKGIAVTSLVLMMAFGELMMKVVFLKKTVITLYLVMGLVIVQLVMMMILVETPSYFVKKGEIEKARNALASLKSLPSNEQYVTDAVAYLSKESDRARAGGNINVFSMARNQVFRAGLKIGLALQTLTVLGGRLVFLDHTRVLNQSGVFVEESWTLAAPAVMLAGALVTVTLVDLWERKYLLATSYAMTTVALGVLAVFMQADMQATALPWVPKTCLLVVVLGYAVGSGLVVLLSVEMFNFEIRSTQVAVVFTYAKILEIAHLHTFQYIEDWAGIHCLFYIFAIINLAGVVYALFAVPYCKNKCVRQIEKQLKRVPILK